MELDFTPIRNASAGSAANSPRDKPPVSPKLQALSDENRAKLEHATNVYAEYQKNTLISDSLQCEINKGLKSGEDIYSLFLKAAKVISLMTNNATFYDVARKDLISIYGAGLKESSVMEIELKDVQTRLNKLKQAAEREQDADDLSRIKTAIEYHEKAVERIQKQIAKSLRESA